MDLRLERFLVETEVLCSLVKRQKPRNENIGIH